MDVDTTRKWWTNVESLVAVQQLVHVNSVLIRPSPDTSQPNNVSVTLEPSLFPINQYQYLWGLQNVLNELIDAVSRDHDFIVKAFKRIAEVDDFLKRLFHIYITVTEHGYKERVTLGLHRMDYMLDYTAGQLGIKQVEMNTMASSLGPLAENLQTVHKYVTSRYAQRPPNSIFPDCPCTTGLCDGIATAWKAYNSQHAQVLFVVGENEKNVYDHRLMEYYLWNKHKIKSLRRTLLDISSEGKLDQQRQLFIGDIEIAIVYYRSGYTPEQYPTQKEWDARLMCEMSCASNCPNLPYLFVGFKKVQQLLASKETLARYCKDPVVVDKILKVFAGQYSLDLTPDGDAAAMMGIEQPDKFVMKPQREGGGNNIYGIDIRTKLTELSSSQQREEYILMERIQPPAVPGVIWWRGKDEQIDDQLVVNELGIYGAYVRSGDKVLYNTPAGQMFKTKAPSSDEGGVGYGVSALDTPLLIPDQQYIEYLKQIERL